MKFFYTTCIQNINTIHTIIYRMRNLQIREIEISALTRRGLKQNTKFGPGPGPDCLDLSEFKTDSFS